ncbi:MAG: cysteine methyltransferase [Verrucomicrobia bacterium]|nr:MAG: cysteine methyltransferase [Verrucomicrobiota bacterium]
MTREIRAAAFAVPIRTGDGKFVAHYSEKGLCGLEFPSGKERTEPEVTPQELPAQIRRWHEATANALFRALAGQVPAELPPLDLSRGTEFQQRVWQALRQIPFGETWSYAQVAQAIGRPKAVRAVGGACGANPIPVLVPCHRVVAANHGLGGFSSGLEWKRRLLAREGVRLQLVAAASALARPAAGAVV